MVDNFVHNVREEDARNIISEFDSSVDGTMQYNEFQNMVLPAADQDLRDRIVYGRRPQQDPSRPLPVQVTSSFVRLLELEMKHANSINDARTELSKNADFQRNRAFTDVSQGFSSINMSDLTQFCEKNGFYPRSDDLESILRRCDHDADRLLNQEEFYELVELT